MAGPTFGQAWRRTGRPSRTLRAAARWPAALLDHRPVRRPVILRSGRRDGPSDRTKGWTSGRGCLGRLPGLVPRVPFLAGLEQRVEDHQHLAHARDQRHLARLAALPETVVEGL